MALLELKDISIRFGGVHALKDVTFSVDEGEYLGLMGPNGAGKTTVINCISGIYRPYQGQIVFEGVDLLSMRGHRIADLGISRTFQDLNFLNLISEMSVMEFLKVGQFSMFPPSLLSDALQKKGTRENDIALKKRAFRILEFFRENRDEFDPPEESRGYPILMGRGGFPDLIDVEKQPLGILSFAWRRRLDLARALVSNPKLLLLDEPAQGLAPSEMQNLGKLLKKIQDEFKVAALIVEHNVPLVSSVSNRILAMHHGEKVAEGKPEEILANKQVIEIYLGDEKDKSSGARQEPAKSQVDPLSTKPILEVKDLDLFYGQAQALSKVSIKVYPRQIVSLIGTNGSGKSSLLRAVSGIEKPASGEIYVNGDYVPLGWPERAVELGIQYVPQGHPIFPKLTVAENLEVGRIAYERRGLKADIERVFHYFPELKELRRVPAVDLSGGLQQMLTIGQAIVGRPDCLLVDEPTLGLAPKLVRNLFAAIKRISEEEKCAVLLVEQSVSLCLEMSDYIYMMSVGLIIGQGEAALYREDPSLIRKSLGFA